MKRNSAWLCLAFVAGSIAAAEKKPAVRPSIFARIYVENSTRQVHLVDSQGHDVSVPKDPNFEAVSDPKIAGDRTTAGWLVEMRIDANYPVGVGVAIFRGGKVIRTFTSSGLPVIVAWSFFLHGKQVGYAATGAHGPDADRTTYELHDVQTGRMLGTWNDDNSGAPPDWVQHLQNEPSPGI